MAAAAPPAQITIRRFIAGDPSSILKKLAFLDMKHDFTAKVTTDMPYPKRGRPGTYNFFPGFKTTIVRKVMGLGSTYSYQFDGCDATYGDPEEFGLNEAIQSAGLKKEDIVKISFPLKNSGTTTQINKVYSDVYDIFTPYAVRVGGTGRIPLVIDFQYQLLNHCRLGTIKNLTDKFVICKNREHYADPGRTSRIGFPNIIELTETGREERRYASELTSIPGTVVTSWNDKTQQCTIQYGSLEWNETYSKDMKVYPNTISMCLVTANSLIKQNTDNRHDVNISREGKGDQYCTKFKDSKEYEGVQFDENKTYVKRIAAQFMKKRLADQLQAASCQKPVTYKEGIILGAETPCVFWTHDRLAAAYAILLKVPCILEHNETAAGAGSLTLYRPRAPGGAPPAEAPPAEAPGGAGTKQGRRGKGGDVTPSAKRDKLGAAGGGSAQIGGAACTRAGIDAIVNGASNSTPLLRYLDDPDCKNYLLQMSMTFSVKEGETYEQNPYFNFDILKRYIDYKLVQAGAPAAAAAAAGGGGPGEPWDGWPDSIHAIKPSMNGRFYVDKAKDLEHIKDRSANVYVNDLYAVRRDTDTRYKLMKGNDETRSIDITGFAEGLDEHLFHLEGGGEETLLHATPKAPPPSIDASADLHPFSAKSNASLSSSKNLASCF